MHNTKFLLITIVCILWMFSCGNKDVETEASPDVDVERVSGDNSTFSENSNDDSLDLNIENKEIENQEFQINQESKEPEMFENKEFEKDFEIPAFLRKQKN